MKSRAIDQPKGENDEENPHCGLLCGPVFDSCVCQMVTGTKEGAVTDKAGSTGKMTKKGMKKSDAKSGSMFSDGMSKDGMKKDSNPTR